jgi:7,8-dihydropterin-6-yl-methyl-4-(beta-D-ribofuranosyl)aminobenzene 5'-phosphate synthase
MNTSSPTLKIVVDNHAAVDLVQEHGFSVWIEAGGQRILFDTGQGKALRPNTERTRNDPAHADVLVLSHGHYDHTGAIDYVLQQNPEIPVFAHTAVLSERYSIYPGKDSKDISMPSEQRLIVENLTDSHLSWVNEPMQIAPGVHLTGPIPRNHPLEDTGGPFFKNPEGTEPDPILDDMALWIETPQGLLVVCGCCHSGFINTITHIQQASGEQRIRGIVGGLHLKNASPERLEATTEALKIWNPDFMVPCHCTGEAAINHFKKYLTTDIRTGFAGFELKTS